MVYANSAAYPTLAVIQEFDLAPWSKELYDLSYLVGCELTEINPAYKIDFEQLNLYMAKQLGDTRWMEVQGKLVENARRAAYAVKGYVKFDRWLAAGVPVPAGPMLYN
jgi:hypothetical protein